MRYEPQSGALTARQTVTTLPAGFQDNNSTADIHVHPSGKFLYGSNRGHDSIAMFSIDSATGRLTPIGHEPTQGKTPRNFAIHPSGSFLLAANQATNTIVVFRIDQESGQLSATGHRVDVPSPVCIQMMQTGD
jgi:6-phosphogluconolactonase